jgi:hypothetical protein
MTLFLALLIAIPAAPQTRGNIADQQACYLQAKQVVAEKIQEAENEKAFHESYSFTQAHYDGKVQVCYVEYSHIIYIPTNRNGEYSNTSYVHETVVADAFEGKTVATLVLSVDTSDGYKETVSTDIAGTCQVNGETCTSHATFNGLLWKFIPAFKPVNAKETR